MHHLTSNLLLYTTPSANSILENLGYIAKLTENDELEAARRAMSVEVKHILDLSTAYGFSRNLWQAYLTYHLVTCENSFSLTCERVGATEGGSINNSYGGTTINIYVDGTKAETPQQARDLGRELGGELNREMRRRGLVPA